MKRLALLLLLGLVGPASAQPVIPLTQASAPIAITTNTTTRLVTGVTGLRIYVTAVDVVAGGTGDIQFVSGRGNTCATGQANVTGNYPLTAQVGFTKGSGQGVLWVLPAGESLCAITDQAVTMAGSISWAQF